jgi:hypothetical protein
MPIKLTEMSVLFATASVCRIFIPIEYILDRNEDAGLRRITYPLYVIFTCYTLYALAGQALLFCIDQKSNQLKRSVRRRVLKKNYTTESKKSSAGYNAKNMQ